MKKKTIALFSATVLAAAAIAGCSSSKTAEATAPAETEKAPETTVAETQAPEVKKLGLLVAGGDGAGLVAAIQAVEEGLDPSKVIIVEKSDKLAADIAGMDAFVNAYNTNEQFEQEIEDTFETYLADIKAAGNDKNDQVLAEFVAEGSEEALDWLRNAGIKLDGVTKEGGSSVARSYAASGDVDLTQAVTEMLQKKVEELKIQVMTETTVDEILFETDGSVSGVKLTGKDGQETIECATVLLTDKELLPLLEKETVTFTKDAEEKATGLLVNTCAEVIKEGEETVLGLYAAGSMIDAAVNGDKALVGNQITGMVLLGSTAGTEAAIYVSDNQ